MKNMDRSYYLVCSLITLLSVLAFMCPGEACAASKAQAMVANLQGSAELASGGSSKKPLAILTELAEGDIITVKDKSTARIVFYLDTHSEILQGPCKVKITAKSCVLQEGAPGCVSLKAPYKGIKSLNSIAASGEKFGGVSARGANSVSFISPKGAVTSLRPVFRWGSIDGATQYVITLNDEKGAVVTKLQSASTSVNYPDSIPGLGFGKTYTWTVNAYQGSSSMVKGTSAFTIVSKETRGTREALEKQVEAQLKENGKDMTPYSVLLAFYMENLLYDDALDTCRKLLDSDSSAANIHHWMSRIYEAKGMKKEAEEEERKAGAPTP